MLHPVPFEPASTVEVIFFWFGIHGVDNPSFWISCLEMGWKTSHFFFPDFLSFCSICNLKKFTFGVYRSTIGKFHTHSTKKRTITMKYYSSQDFITIYTQSNRPLPSAICDQSLWHIYVYTKNEYFNGFATGGRSTQTRKKVLRRLLGRMTKNRNLRKREFFLFSYGQAKRYSTNPTHLDCWLWI